MENANENDRTVDELQKLANQSSNTPREFKDLHPHERVLLHQIGHMAEFLQLKDDEFIQALVRITNHLRYQLDEKRKATSSDKPGV